MYIGSMVFFKNYLEKQSRHNTGFRPFGLNGTVHSAPHSAHVAECISFLNAVFFFARQSLQRNGALKSRSA